jgi:ubiquinone biosynthesis protein
MLSRWSYFQRAIQVSWVCLRNLIEIFIDRVRGRPTIPGPERLRLLLEEVSGSFLKFGQILSLQVDALPREYCDALLSLLDRVPPFPREQVRDVFIGDLGKPPESLYREFDYSPIASASIGQVHRAVLFDSTKVAVKVQRPGIEGIFMRDAAMLRLFVKIVFLLRITSLYFMRDPVREFNDWILDELDYRREASYAEVLGRNARETPSESVPKIHWDLTGARILTMDFLEGYSVMEYIRLRERRDLHRLEELEQIGFDPPKFVSNVINNFLSDAFKFGVFHADLHPANLLIMKDNVVGYVDFGIVGSMTPEARRKQIQLSLAYVRGKTDEIFDAFMNVCTFTKESDLAGFRRELDRRSRYWYREPAIGGVPHFSRSLTVAMIDLLALCRYYGVLVDREMIKYIRSLFLADGLVSRLAPGLDLAPQIRQVCEDFIARDAQGRMLSGGAALTLLADLSGWMLAGPSRMLHALELMDRRQVRLQMRADKSPSRMGGLRVRSLFAAVVWLALAIFSMATYENIFTKSSFSGYLVITFWGVWTVWLVDLLRRVARQ